MQEKYDVVIIGGGPAGLTSAIYALRGGLSVALIENNIPGGQVNYSYEVVNYPGFDKISGSDLAMRMLSQAENLGLKVIYENIEQLNLKEKKIITNSSQILASCIILAMGSKARKLNIPGEEKFAGNGVHYCAVCDGGFYKNRTVAMIGGGDSAVEESLYLSNICKKVYVVHKKNDLACQPYLKEKLLKCKNVEIIANAISQEIVGEEQVVALKYSVMQKVKKLSIDGVFVAIGHEANNDLVRGQIELSNKGYIVSDESMHTSVNGVFVAGDVREKPLRQIITACADGAIAGNEAIKYINKRG